MENKLPESESEHPPEGFLARITHGRKLEPILGPWIGCAVAFVLVFLFEYEMPAFHDFVKVFYFVIAVVFIISTARYFRPRDHDRRHRERRVSDRRKRKPQ